VVTHDRQSSEVVAGYYDEDGERRIEVVGARQSLNRLERSRVGFSGVNASGGRYRDRPGDNLVGRTRGMSEHTRLSRRDYLAGAGVVGTAGLAGCTGIVGSGASSPDTLRLAYMPIYPDMQYFVMEEEGYFDDLGVDVEAQQFPDGPSIVQAYASGKFDVAMFGIVPSMVVVDKGLSAKVVAADIKDAMSIMTTTEFQTLWQDHGTEAFAKFEEQQGRKFRFGTFPPGSVPDIVLRYWMTEELGLDVEKTVEVVPMGASKVQQALLAGEIDGTSIMEPIQTIATGTDEYVRLQNAAEFFPGGQPAAVVLMNDTFRTGNSDVGQAFVEQHVRATEFIEQNPEKAAQHAVSVIGEQNLDLETAKQAMRSPTANFVSDPHDIEGGTKIFADFAHQLGKTSEALTVDDVFDYSLYDGR
jgi:NitT/TauT family transport system substrate-binding protein